MSHLMLVCLSGERRGKTFVFDKEAVTLGAAPGCDVVLDLPPANGGGALAEIHRNEKRLELFVHDADHYSFRINDEPRRTEDHGPIPLAHGDVVAVGTLDTQKTPGVAELLVQLIAPERTAPRPLNARLQFPEVDAGGHIHPRSATRFLKELVFALYAEMPGWVRAVALLLTGLVPLSVLTATGLVFYFGWNYAKLVSELRVKNEKSAEQIEKLLAVIEKKDEVIKTITETANFAPKIAANYRDGVCLILVTYSYTDSQKRPLRYLDHSFDNGLAVSADGKLNVSFEGTGNIYSEESTGTGFVVGEGKILTNRHIAQPWFGDPNDKLIINNLGGKPEIKEIYAYFPQHKTPFALKQAGFSTESDVALCQFDPASNRFPSLPLAGLNETADPTQPAADITGQAIVIMGFPTGADGIIAQLADSQFKTEIERKLRNSEKASALAQRGNLLPVVSQGHITRLVAGRITHDAPTTEGGSGSPIFNSAGKVIGINAQVTVDQSTGGQVPGGNIAVPIQAALTLIRSEEEK